jgi:hypothetical protein
MLDSDWSWLDAANKKRLIEDEKDVFTQEEEVKCLEILSE